MRRALMAVAFVGSCAHVPPASPTSIEGVPSPWPEARAQAGNAPVQRTQGGAVIKPGKPPPVVPLGQPPPSSDAPQIHDTFDRSTAPTGGPQPKLNLPVPARRKLKNGASLLVVERHQLPLLSMVIAWPVGAADETPAQAGVAALTADLLDEGAGKMGPLELADEVQRLGAQLHTGAGWDDTTVAVTTLTRALDALLPIVADVVMRPAFDEKEVARVRADRLTALVQQRDVPSMVAHDTLARVVYGDKLRYGQPLAGTEATLGALGRADVVKWHRERLRPDLATIIVVGDVRPDEIARKLDGALAGWTAATKTKLKHAPLVAPSPSRRVAIVDRPGAAQTDMRLGLPGVPRASKDYFACLVANAVLGGQFVSRLNMNLREKHGYTYGARTEFAFRRAGGPFVAGAPVKTAVTEPSLKETLGELARIRESDIGDGELRLAKDLLERALARDFETPPQVAGALVAQVVEGLPDDYFKTYADKIEAVTIADVRRAAQKWIDPTKMSIVLVGDESQIGPGVQTMVGEYERRGTDGAPLPKATEPAGPRSQR